MTQIVKHVDVYKMGQLAHMVSWVQRPCDWLLLGGPADADEAFTFLKYFPKGKVIGFEPDDLFYNLQLSRKFPGTLLNCAVWNVDGSMYLIRKGDSREAHRSSSCIKYLQETEGDITTVRARTLDSLDKEYGPFNNALLWLDIEGAELHALRGAKKLLERGACHTINLEVFSGLESKIRDMLAGYGYSEVYRWNHQQYGDRSWSDIVYRKE